MSNKSLLKFIGAFGVLAMLLIFLGVNYVPRISALPSAKENAVDAAYYAGSDWIERHPPAVVNPNYYAGSDWIERHPSNYYAGSDWIERHPSVAAKAVNYAGSDWIERHPSNYYVGSDWIERHPGQPDH
jgi:cbb3-type cytochrome oxidase subunit 3